MEVNANTAPIEVRDLRRREFFMTDDEYLNGYARHCGIYATGVYMSLCRHANKDQQSFPSISLMSEELAISRPSVKRALKKLAEYNIIAIEQVKSEKNEYMNNLYTLIDKSSWRQVGGRQPQTPGRQPQTLGRQPQTLGRQPQTLGRQPRTLGVGNHRPQVGSDVYSKETHTSKHIKRKHIQVKEKVKRKVGNEKTKRILEVFNENMGTKYTSARSFEANLLKWLEEYTVEEITTAIGRIKDHPYWRDKDVDPAWLFRKKNQQGEPVDYIGQLLNTKRKEVIRL